MRGQLLHSVLAYNYCAILRLCSSQKILSRMRVGTISLWKYQILVFILICSSIKDNIRIMDRYIRTFVFYGLNCLSLTNLNLNKEMNINTRTLNKTLFYIMLDNSVNDHSFT